MKPKSLDEILGEGFEDWFEFKEHNCKLGTNENTTILYEVWKRVN